MDGNRDLWVREPIAPFRLTECNPEDILIWTHEARELARCIRAALAAEPRRKAPKKAENG